MGGEKVYEKDIQAKIKGSILQSKILLAHKKQNQTQSRFKDPLKEDIEAESQSDPNHTFAFTKS